MMDVQEYFGARVADLEREVTRAHKSVESAMLSYLQGGGDETELERAARAEGEARFRLECVRQRAKLDSTVAQIMGMARSKYRATASLRDPRPFVRGVG